MLTSMLCMSMIPFTETASELIYLAEKINNSNLTHKCGSFKLFVVASRVALATKSDK